MFGLPAHMLCAMVISGTHGDQKSGKSPGTIVIHGYEIPYECWELNPGPPKK